MKRRRLADNTDRSIPLIGVIGISERRANMNARSTLRRIEEDGQLVLPLSGPSYGAYSIARRRWRKPIPAIIADAIANCRAVSALLQRGIYALDEERDAHYQTVFDTLSKSTHRQVEALEAFAAIDWRE
jgi:hypothetical protein